MMKKFKFFNVRLFFVMVFCLMSSVAFGQYDEGGELCYLIDCNRFDFDHDDWWNDPDEHIVDFVDLYSRFDTDGNGILDEYDNYNANYNDYDESIDEMEEDSDWWIYLDDIEEEDIGFDNSNNPQKSYIPAEFDKRIDLTHRFYVIPTLVDISKVVTSIRVKTDLNYYPKFITPPNFLFMKKITAAPIDLQVASFKDRTVMRLVLEYNKIKNTKLYFGNVVLETRFRKDLKTPISLEVTAFLTWMKRLIMDNYNLIKPNEVFEFEGCPSGDCACTTDCKSSPLEQAKFLLNSLSKPYLNGDEMKQVREDYIEKQTPEVQKELYRKLYRKLGYVNQRTSESKVQPPEKEQKQSLPDRMCQFSAISSLLEYLGIANPDPTKAYADSLEDLRHKNWPVPNPLPEEYEDEVSDHPNYRKWHRVWEKVIDKMGAKLVNINVQGRMSKGIFIDKVQKVLNEGKGILLGVGGHVICLQDINEKGIIVDDSYGKNNYILRSIKNGTDAWTRTNKGTKKNLTHKNNEGENVFIPWHDVEKIKFIYMYSIEKKN